MYCAISTQLLLPLNLLFEVGGHFLLDVLLLGLQDPAPELVGPDIAVECLAVGAGGDYSVLGQVAAAV